MKKSTANDTDKRYTKRQTTGQIKKSINETRSALILKLFQMKNIRLLNMGAGVLDEMELKAYHHLYVTLPSREGKYYKFLATKSATIEFQRPNRFLFDCRGFKM